MTRVPVLDRTGVCKSKLAVAVCNLQMSGRKKRTLRLMCFPLNEGLMGMVIVVVFRFNVDICG